MYSHLRPAARRLITRLSTHISQSTRSTFTRNITTYQNRSQISASTSKVPLPFLSRNISSSRTLLQQSQQSQQQKMDPSPSGSNATTKADPAPAAPSPVAAPTGSSGSSTSPGAGSTSPSSPTVAAESTTTTSTSTSSTTANPNPTVTDASTDSTSTTRPSQFGPEEIPSDPLQDPLSIESQRLTHGGPLPLPSPESATPVDPSSAPKVVTVNGQAVALDNLGPMVVHKDGTISRIANWGEMTDLERQNTLRILGKRNQLRLTNLREGRVNGEGM